MTSVAVGKRFSAQTVKSCTTLGVCFLVAGRMKLTAQLAGSGGSGRKDANSGLKQEVGGGIRVNSLCFAKQHAKSCILVLTS